MVMKFSRGEFPEAHKKSASDYTDSLSSKPDFSDCKNNRSDVPDESQAGGASDIMSSYLTPPAVPTFPESRNLACLSSFGGGFEADGETESLVHFGEGF